MVLQWWPWGAIRFASVAAVIKVYFLLPRRVCVCARARRIYVCVCVCVCARALCVCVCVCVCLRAPSPLGGAEAGGRCAGRAELAGQRGRGPAR